MEKEIKYLEEKILSRSAEPEFMLDLMNWAREKYSRARSKSKLLDKFHSRNLYFKFLSYVCNSNIDTYDIIYYLSHGEQAPMPLHIRLLLNGNKDKIKDYIKNIKFNHSE